MMCSCLVAQQSLGQQGLTDQQLMKLAGSQLMAALTQHSMQPSICSTFSVEFEGLHNPCVVLLRSITGALLQIVQGVFVDSSTELS